MKKEEMNKSVKKEKTKKKEKYKLIENEKLKKIELVVSLIVGIIFLVLSRICSSE